MVRTDLINPEKLDEHIELLKDMYLTSHVNTLKIPSFITRCEEEIEKSPEKKEMLEKQIEDHKSTIQDNKDQMKNLSEIFDRVVEFKSSL